MTEFEERFLEEVRRAKKPSRPLAILERFFPHERAEARRAMEKLIDSGRLEVGRDLTLAVLEGICKSGARRRELCCPKCRGTTDLRGGKHHCRCCGRAYETLAELRAR